MAGQHLVTLNAVKTLLLLYQSILCVNSDLKSKPYSYIKIKNILPYIPITAIHISGSSYIAT